MLREEFEGFEGKEGSIVDLLAVVDSNDQDNANVVLNIAQNAILIDAVTPNALQFTFKLFAETAWIFITNNAFIQITNDPFGCSFIDFFSCFKARSLI